MFDHRLTGDMTMGDGFAMHADWWAHAETDAHLETFARRVSFTPSTRGVDVRYLSAIRDHLEVRLHRWLVRYSIVLLRVALGGIFLGFGLLKFFPGFSPAESLAVRTFALLTLGLVPATVARVFIATLECAIGLSFLTGRCLRVGLVLLGVQMLGALSPLVLLTGEMFSGSHHAPSLEGQYVIKDVVLIAAGMVIAATVKGSRLVSERERVAPVMARHMAGDSQPAPPSTPHHAFAAERTQEAA